MKSLQEIWDKLTNVEADVNGVQAELNGIQTDIGSIATNLGAVANAVDSIVVDTRTPITSLPMTISTSGSYYLQGNLQHTHPTAPAITIDAENVVIDLNGFTLSSTSTVTGSAFSLPALTDLKTLTVKNGAVTGTTQVDNVGTTWTATPGGFFTSIVVTGSNSIVNVSDLSVSRCRSSGIAAGTRSNVRNCRAYQNGGDGFRGVSTSIIENCVSVENVGDGFDLSVSQVSNCSAHRNKGTGFRLGSASAHHCTSNVNGAEGFLVTSNSGILAFCNAILNGGAEISAGASVIRTSNYPAP